MNILCIGNGTLSVAHQELVIAGALKSLGHSVKVTHDLEWGFFNQNKIPSPLEPGDLIITKHGDYKDFYPVFDFGKTDIIFGLDQSVVPFVYTMRKKLGCPAVAMMLDFPKHVIDEGSPADFNPDYSNRYYTWINMLNDIDGIVYNNEIAANHVSMLLEREVHLVWYPLCNLDAISKIEKRKSDPYVVSCHRFINYKGTEYLIKALYGVPIDYRAISVSGNLEQQITGFGQDMLGGRFIKMPKLSEEDKLQTIANAEVLVYPQITDWVGGLSPLEAMALRVPVVCFDYPVLRELYEDCAVYAKKKDIDSLQEKILMVLNEEYDKSIIDRAQERIQSNFHPNQMAKKLIAVFEKYCGE